MICSYVAPSQCRTALKGTNEEKDTMLWESEHQISHAFRNALNITLLLCHEVIHG